MKIINIVNGNICNLVRLSQFKEVCQRLDIPFKKSIVLIKDSY
jgi:hypothetical protein